MCRNCSQNKWVNNAQNFLQNSNNRDIKYHTVDYLLNHANNGNGACGINNRVPIEDILTYLRSLNFNVTREEFQQGTLIQLKQKGIVATLIYPGPQGGVFIPCSENEIIQVANQVIDRVISELEHLRALL